LVELVVSFAGGRVNSSPAIQGQFITGDNTGLTTINGDILFLSGDTVIMSAKPWTGNTASSKPLCPG
jgi:hypothetical protein